ncbi:MAG: helix-hairpin-helix domain-containing protein [Aphanocapsa sp. GSE-SYN-MK-11-07L]|nr:helix-hairpin-helix domain-containing protein [Aphanocapsa sp. GSE-SYN-MK-11-07L]
MRSLRKVLHKHGRFIALLLLGLGLVAYGISQIPHSALRIQNLSSLPQYPLIQVYMNHRQSQSYTDPYRQISRPGDNLEQIMLDAIRQAKVSIDVAVQEFRLPQLAHALVERQQAGVKVRVVMENTYTQPWSSLSASDLTNPVMRERYESWKKLVDLNANGDLAPAEINQRDVLSILNQGQVAWLDDTADRSQGSLLMHHKFIVIDGQTLVATTANFTLSDVHGDIGQPDTRGNANSLLLIDSRDLAALFTQEFNYMWGDGPGGEADSRFGVNKPFRPPQQVKVGEATVDVKFSPSSQTVAWAQTTNGLIGSTLSSARKSINMALFVLSDQQLADNLEADHQRGVGIRLLVDPGFIYRDFSEALDLLGVQLANTGQAKQGKCYYEADNRPWASPIPTVGTPVLPAGDKLHHKYGAIDGQTVIVGSHNWSAVANRGNDEFLLVIRHPTVAAHYEQEFDRLYANSRLGIPKFLQAKIADQLKQCGGVIQARGATVAQPSSSSVAAIMTDQRINLNTATATQLESLPGVGPKLAAEIIATRTQKAFTSLKDIDEVPGIGPGLLDKIKDRITW